MDKLFAPIKDLVGGVYGVLYDAACKVWSLAKPVILIGLVVDLVTGKLGWIGSIMEYYRQFLNYTSGTSWMVLLIAGVILFGFFSKK